MYFPVGQCLGGHGFYIRICLILVHESWTIKKAERWRIDAFELWCWRRLLRVPWTARRSNQSILKEISPEYLLEGLILKLKLQHFGHLMHWLIEKDPDAEKDWGQEENGMTEDCMAGWHHQLDRHEFEWTPGVGDGQGGLVCCDSWGRKELDTTEQLNWLTDWICYSIASVFYLFVLVLGSWPQGMWDISSQTRSQTCTPCLGRQCLSHWTAMEGPICLFLVSACKVFFFWRETQTHVLVTEAFI